MNININPPKQMWNELVARPQIDRQSLAPMVGDVLAQVRERGDEALRELTLKFDKVIPENWLVSEWEFDEAEQKLSDTLKDAIRAAKENIAKFHSAQMPKQVEVETAAGVRCWQKAFPINKIGLYVPGGSAPLFSTVLMLAVPAQIAGCEEVVLCTPPNKEGKINPAILFAARLTGVKRVFKVGGSQAIAAMAFGTETIPQVDKIFGPGNQYVTCAKQLVSSMGVAIDMPAGPSEVLVVADEQTPVEFAAADLLSQAEHGPDSQVVLVSLSQQKIEDIWQETQRQLDELPRKEFATKALSNSRFVCFNDMATAMDFVNAYAPEHLILSVSNPEEWAARVRQAGSVFMGYYSCESAGDYASGTNHTLPTNGYARAYSGVNIDSFMKKITFQQLTAEGIRHIGPTIETMAAAEMLDGHKNAVTVRLKAVN
ncbi:MAG: histidinol dehydrogenase [Salinivirgaceae bacterium]|nr:histidinol dehydrogenase [Salinivirgaceae bacterium]